MRAMIMRADGCERRFWFLVCVLCLCFANCSWRMADKRTIISYVDYVFF